jgi:hypothetical protein
LSAFNAPLTLVRAALARAPDRRRFFRADVEIDGRILNSENREIDCRTADISAGGARLTSSIAPAMGEKILLYLGELGRTPAEVVRVGKAGEFAVTFIASNHKREKIAERLTWLLNKDLFADGPESEGRRETRFSAGGVIDITLEDGTALTCDVRDFSLLGCSLRTIRQRPPIGVWVRIGMTYGRVARYFEDGFAVDFEPRPAR